MDPKPGTSALTPDMIEDFVIMDEKPGTSAITPDIVREYIKMTERPRTSEITSEMLRGFIDMDPKPGTSALTPEVEIGMVHLNAKPRVRERTPQMGIISYINLDQKPGMTSITPEVKILIPPLRKWPKACTLDSCSCESCSRESCSVESCSCIACSCKSFFARAEHSFINMNDLDGLSSMGSSEMDISLPNSDNEDSRDKSIDSFLIVLEPPAPTTRCGRFMAKLKPTCPPPVCSVLRDQVVALLICIIVFLFLALIYHYCK